MVQVPINSTDDMTRLHLKYLCAYIKMMLEPLDPEKNRVITDLVRLQWATDQIGLIFIIRVMVWDFKKYTYVPT
jgi:hypothetical protein